MTSTNRTILNLDELTENMFNYSIDRSEMHLLINQFSSTLEFNRTAIEYEIQLLRILGVGWSISYFVHDKSFKEILLESYWNRIREFSDNLSSISSATLSQDFNYFNVIKERLDLYLTEFNRPKNAEEPATVIGPTFAELCGQPDDAVVIWLGSKMFQSVLTYIKTYLSNVQFVRDDKIKKDS